MPLHVAASLGHPAVLRVLLDAGADISSKDQVRRAGEFGQAGRVFVAGGRIKVADSQRDAEGR